jgi:hypothetical protein
MSHIFPHRRVGVLVLTGAAAGLITFAVGSGTAAANPNTPYVPGVTSVDSDSVALNPQPLPPFPDLVRWGMGTPADPSPVALNPQPLPPSPDLVRWGVGTPADPA